VNLLACSSYALAKLLLRLRPERKVERGTAGCCGVLLARGCASRFCKFLWLPATASELVQLQHDPAPWGTPAYQEFAKFIAVAICGLFPSSPTCSPGEESWQFGA
jgi:hypothetical protein